MRKFLGKILRALPAIITWPLARIFERLFEFFVYETSYYTRSFSDKRSLPILSRQTAEELNHPDNVLMVTMRKSENHWLG